jgi:hypothetical protein
LSGYYTLQAVKISFFRLTRLEHALRYAFSGDAEHARGSFQLRQPRASNFTGPALNYKRRAFVYTLLDERSSSID